MDEDNLILDLIIAKHIEDDPYVESFSYKFIFDFLSMEDKKKLFKGGVPRSYSIVKKRREEAESYFTIPIFVENEGTSAIICPEVFGNYNDKRLYEELPGALRRIDVMVREAGIKELVMASEEAEAKIIESRFKELGYKVNIFYRVEPPSSEIGIDVKVI